MLRKLRFYFGTVNGRVQTTRLFSQVGAIPDTLQVSEQRPTVKRKVALTVGFVGSKYYGMQFNAHSEMSLPTIEEEVLRSLHTAGYISDMNANKPTKVKLSRASRTDKGVHAVRTVLTLKLLVPRSKISEKNSSNTVLRDLPDEVNKHLPNDIRIFGAITTNAGFGGKNCCGWRSYEYLLPLSMLAPKSHGGAVPALGEEGSGDLFDVEKLQKILSQFEGTHSFHNFNNEKKEKNKKWGSAALKGAKWTLAAHSMPTDNETSVDEDIDDDDEEEEDAPEIPSSVANKTSSGEPWKLKKVSSTMYSVRVLPGLVHARTQASGDTNVYGGGGGDLQGPVHIPSHLFFSSDGAFDPAVPVSPVSSTAVGDRKMLNDSTFVRIRIAGKFFLYKQIRIMIGTAVAVYSGVLPDHAITTALKFNAHKLSLPVAPAEGLMCVDAGFDRNKGGKNFVTNFEVFAEEASVFRDLAADNLGSSSSSGATVSGSEDAKVAVDMYFPLLEKEGFDISDRFKYQAIYRTVMALFTPDVARRWHDSLEDNFGSSSDALRLLAVAAEEETRGDDDGFKAFKLRQQEEDWHSLARNVAQFRSKYMVEADVEAADAHCQTDPLNADTISNNSSMTAWDQSNSRELRSVNYYTRLRVQGVHKAGAVAYHPYKLFLPRNMATELALHFQKLPGSVVISETLRAIATDVVLGDIYSMHVAPVIATVDRTISNSVDPSSSPDNILLTCTDLCEYISNTGGLEVWTHKPKHSGIQ